MLYIKVKHFYGQLSVYRSHTVLGTMKKWDATHLFPNMYIQNSVAVFWTHANITGQSAVVFQTCEDSFESLIINKNK
jgi:hypothetical protein